MKKVLFVCHGSICRSPMAEFIFKKIIKDKGLEDAYYCESRAVSSEELGNDIYPPAKRCLDKHQIPYKRHYATKISNKDYKEFDVIFVMDDSNLYRIKRIFDDDEHKIRKLMDDDIEDPWWTDNFDKVYAEIVEGIEKYLGENQ